MQDQQIDQQNHWAQFSSIPAMWWPLLSLACLLQQAAALVATPIADYLAGHDLGVRTVTRHSGSAEVSDVGEVHLHRQVPWSDDGVLLSFADQTVSGSIMLLTINPPRFVSNATVLSAVREAVRAAAERSGRETLPLSVKEVRASLALSDDFPDAVRVHFQVSFGSRKDRQTFTLSVATSNGQMLAEYIDKQVPNPFNGRCRLPNAAPLDVFSDRISLLKPTANEAPSAAQVNLAGHADGRSFGNFTWSGVPDAWSIVNSTEWQEALAMAISEAAWVPRLEVGTMMAIESQNAVSVDFWVMSRNANLRQAAIGRVLRSPGAIYNRSGYLVADWALSDQVSVARPLYGRIGLLVPSPEHFASSLEAKKALQKSIGIAAARTAKSLGSKETNQSAPNVTVLLAVVKNTTDVVRVKFQVDFLTMRDRESFMADVSLDGAEKLVDGASKHAPKPFEGKCRLPGQYQTQVERQPELGHVYRKFWFRVRGPQQVASEPSLPDAMAMAVAEMASVPPEQVGVLLGPSRTLLWVNFWVASPNRTFRQVAMSRLRSARLENLTRRALVHMDRLEAQPLRSGSVEQVQGSIALQVPSPRHFANGRGVRQALVRAISRVVGVPTSQVRRVDILTDLWENFPTVVRIAFVVAFRNATEASKMASDGGNALVASINEQVPEPFKGNCWLPAANRTQATLATELGRPSGTILLNLFRPEIFVPCHRAREAVARAIAEVAAVAPPQVGMTMAVHSVSSVRVDFWIASSNATLRQAAVERVNAGWTNRRVPGMPASRTEYFGLAFTACGGTVACCRAADARYQC